MPHLPGGLTVRPLTADDLPAAAGLLAAAEPVDDTGEHSDADDLAEWWVNDLVDLPRDSRGVWTDDGVLVAVAVAMSMSAARGRRRRRDTAGLQVDAENPTAAFGSDRRLGSTPVRTRVQWACTRPPGA